MSDADKPIDPTAKPFDVSAKLAQFNEYFSIEYQANCTIIPQASDFEIPDEDTFIKQMPYLFRLATEVATLEQSALRPLRRIGDVAEELYEYLKIQARKIDLLMSYIISQEDAPDFKLVTQRLGGGGITFNASAETIAEYPIGQAVQVKLFLRDEATAIFCYGEVVDIEAHENSTEISVVFSRIRDDDRELLVRASLHAQTKLLKRQRQQREND